MQFFDYFPEVVGENYTFSQTQDEVTISFKVPEQTSKQNINVTVNANSISAGIKNKPPSVVGTLFDVVQTDMSWQFETKKNDKYVTIHLDKAGLGLWPILIKSPKGTEIDTQSLYHLADVYEQGNVPKFPQNLITALNYFKAAADKGSPLAQTKLANIYSLGEKSGYPVTQDDDLALKYAKLGAEGESRDAMTILGQIYSKGGSTAKNIEEGKKWLYKANELGDIMAPFIIALLFIEGEKNPNNTEAIKWFKIASDRGNGLATHALAEMYKDGRTGGPVPEKNSEAYYSNMSESEKYYLKAHEIDPSLIIPDEIKDFQKK